MSLPILFLVKLPEIWRSKFVVFITRACVRICFVVAIGTTLEASIIFPKFVDTAF